MSDYKSNGRVAIENVLRKLRLYHDTTSEFERPVKFSQGYRRGLAVAIETLKNALDELKEGDEETEARVLRNYFYGDSCGAFDN